MHRINRILSIRVLLVQRSVRVMLDPSVWPSCLFFLAVLGLGRLLSLAVASRGSSLLAGCSSRWLLLVRGTGFRRTGFRSRDSRA